VTDRVARWFYGLPNMVGAGLAVGGLAAFIAGVLHGWLVIPIVAGLYAFGAVATPRPKGLTGLVSPDGSLDAGKLRSSLEKLTRESGRRLPPELAAKVGQISQTILEILPKVQTSTIDRQDLFALERTVAEYLPNTIDAYLTLPRAYANSRVVQDGKTAKDLLGDQLDLIEEKMEAISEAVSKDDLNKLLAQGRFLEDRFGTNRELSIGAAPAGPAVKPGRR
jgi:hypothetical protein